MEFKDTEPENVEAANSHLTNLFGVSQNVILMY